MCAHAETRAGAVSYIHAVYAMSVTAQQSSWEFSKHEAEGGR